MNTLTEMQRKAIIAYTADITNRAIEFAMALQGTPAVPIPPAEVIAAAPRKRGRPRKNPLPG
jgi:hypothetical protein